MGSLGLTCAPALPWTAEEISGFLCSTMLGNGDTVKLLTSLQQQGLRGHLFGPGAPSHGLWKRNPLKPVENRVKTEAKRCELSSDGLSILVFVSFLCLFFVFFALFDDTLGSLILSGFSTSNEGTCFHSVHYIYDGTKRLWRKPWLLLSLDLSLLCDPTSRCPLPFSVWLPDLCLHQSPVDANERQLFKGELLFLHQYRTNSDPPPTVCFSKKFFPFC